MPQGRPTRLTFPQRIYLDLCAAEQYPDTAPEYVEATWPRLAWMLVPIIGFLLFTLSVEEAYK